MSQGSELHYAVVVGINRYPGLRDLHQATGDAQAFHAWLIDEAGGAVPAAQAKLITIPEAALPEGTPREEAAPVQRQVFQELNRVRREVDLHIESSPEDWPKTRLYLYVSGHGIAPEPHDAALLMADAGPYDYGENVSCRAIRDFFADSQTFCEVLIFADCCREYADAPLGMPPWTRMKRKYGNVNQAFCCATYFGDYAYEPDAQESAQPDQNRGYFTRALLEGLKGEAADPATGQIDTNTLAGYVHKRVRDLTKTRPHPQEPNLIAEPGRPIVLRPARTTPASNHTVTLQFASPASGTVVLTDGAHRELGRHAIADGPWTLNLANDYYRVAPVGPEMPETPNPFRHAGFFEVRGEAQHVEL